MTEDYKNLLRDYLTGKMPLNSSFNQVRFTSVNIYNNELYTYIADRTVQPQTLSYHLIKGKDGKGQELDEQILYGIDASDNSGFIVVLDFMLNPIQFINKYSSGAKFGIFEELIIDDDGRFYGVEKVSSNNKRRFIMLNNILVKTTNQAEYKVTLRQSYELPTSLQTGTIKKLIKKPLGNKYLFCANTSSSYPLLVQLTVNVGTANEWQEFTYTTNHCNITGAWASWDADDNLKFKIAAIYTSGSTGYLYIFVNNNSSISQENRFNLPEPTASWVQAIVLNEDTIYLGYCYTNGSGVYNQYVDKVTDSLTNIYVSPNTDVAMPGQLIKSEMYTDGFNVFLSYNVPNSDDTIDYYMGIIYNDIVFHNNFGDLTYTTSQMLYATSTFHQFNLYSYYLQLGDTAYVASSIFNNLDYNGFPYTNVNALTPKMVVLNEEAGSPLFARNLYNRVANDNVTVSTVEIPNTVLNYDMGSAFEIAQQVLYSETKQELVKSYEKIDKNIYETVNINFYNTLTMKSINDPNNEIINMPGAIRINKSSSVDNDFFLAQATKVAINYTDGTNYMVALDPSVHVSVTDNVATYSFVIYAPTNKTIKNLEIVSYDELTSYVTINGTFTPGKYYQVTQDVYVE